ncbi:cell division cycle protein 48 [Tanacetum coccineum]
MLVYPDIQYVGSSSIELEGVYSACIPVGKGQPHIFHVKLDQGGPAAPLLARDTKTELGGFTYVDMEKISKETHGYVGADLVALCTEAALQHRDMDMTSQQGEEMV